MLAVGSSKVLVSAVAMGLSGKLVALLLGLWGVIWCGLAPRQCGLLPLMGGASHVLAAHWSCHCHGCSFAYGCGSGNDNVRDGFGCGVWLW